MAEPGRRLDTAAIIVGKLWPPGSGSAWPESPMPGTLSGSLRAGGAGRATAVELAVNAVLPVALAAGAWTENECREAFAVLPSPGTYGKLRRLEGWLGGKAALECANTLQGALLLHANYCTQGRCGRCPLSS